MRVVPRYEFSEKLAAVQQADEYGRQIAQDRAIEKLASAAGAWLAEPQDDGLEKEAGIFSAAKDAAKGLIGKLKMPKVTPPAETAAKAAKSQKSHVGHDAKLRAEYAAAKATARARSAKPVGGPGWGTALGLSALGGTAYGLSKAVPWAMRQMEATSATPMAANQGWSAVPYGYGRSPYGRGMPTLGSRA